MNKDGKNRKLREENVLEIIVQSHILTGVPVGSRCVSQRLNLSSATIRNVMADLEDMGLISHPHTSAGRIPTDSGYRYYVDSLMRVRQLSDREIKEIESEYNSRLTYVDDVLEETTHILSRFTNCACAAIQPAEASMKKKVYLGGSVYILKYPEFRSYEKMANILEFFEEKESISNLLLNDLDEGGVKVHIGSENKAFGLDDLSIVTAGFKMRDRAAGSPHGEAVGRLGIIGPMRMCYDRVIPVVDALANMMTRILSEIAERV